MRNSQRNWVNLLQLCSLRLTVFIEHHLSELKLHLMPWNMLDTQAAKAEEDLMTAEIPSATA